MDPYEQYMVDNEYMDDLQLAHVHAERALNALYKPGGPKRSIWYRMRLGRAQNALISLYVRELKQQKGWFPL